MSISTSRTNPVAGILAAVANSTNTPAAAAGKEDRKPSQFWLNICVKVPTTNQDGTPGDPLVVSLPFGVALDDMKYQVVKGSNADWIALAQGKNQLLDQTREYLAKTLQPGGQIELEQFSVFANRVSAPSQQGSVDDNPLCSVIAGMFTK